LKNKKYLRDLSKGNQKKVGIIATLIGNPEVVILDEPFANLDPTTVSRLKKIIKELAENPAVTVLVSSHDLQHTVEVCDRIVALKQRRDRKRYSDLKRNSYRSWNRFLPYKFLKFQKEAYFYQSIY
jgi:ABC-type multidrug transport system ATPase subunit